ncbi:outer membrane lipoprotein chaperone LolA [Kaarinaea lacus]
MKQLFVSCVVVLLIVAVVPQAVAADSADQQLQRFFNDVQSMSAEFVQTVGSQGFSTVDESRGVFRLQRPGKFRWDYTAPYEQQIIADGKKIWIYDVDMDQIIVKPMDLILGQTPAVLLSGNQSLTDRFHIKNVPSETNSELAWVELRPKDQESSYEKLLLGFHNNDIKAMELIDSFGQTTRLKFSKLQRNPKLDAAIFQFTPPEGVDVIGEGELLPAQ